MPDSNAKYTDPLNPSIAGDLDQLDLRPDDQDKILSQIIFDTEFLQKCIRKGLIPDLFASQVRRDVAEFIWEYFKKYNSAPKDFIMDIWATDSSIRVKKEDKELYYDFVYRLLDVENTDADKKRLFDQLSDFIKRRVVMTAINKLNKTQTQIGGSADTLKDIIINAAQDLQTKISLDKTEDILDNDIFIDSPWLTRFGLPIIDDACGGGLVAPNLVVIQGFTGRGKTWSVTHLIKMALRLGNDVVGFITEMANSKFKHRLRMCMTGMNIKEYYSNQKMARELIQRSMFKGSKLHLVSDEVKMMADGFRIDTIKSIVDDVEERRGKPIKLIIIDSADDMDPPSEFYDKTGYNKLNERTAKTTAVYTWLRKYTQEEDKCVITTSQSQRGAEKLLWTTSGNIGDDINKLRRATLGISINGYKREIDAGYFRLLVNKNTFGPEMKACWCKSKLEIGQFIDEFGEIKGMNINPYKQLLLSRGITLTNTDKDQG